MFQSNFTAVRFGLAWFGEVWSAEARRGQHPTLLRRGEGRSGLAWRGTVRRGEARSSITTKLYSGKVRHGLAGIGEVRTGSARRGEGYK